MQKTPHTPLWVFLVYASIETRRGALWLILGTLLFTLYCVPWAQLFPQPAWLAQIFLLEDWEWFWMMLPFIAWYWLALRWVDKHQPWPES
jgi:hypothetical protein